MCNDVMIVCVALLCVPIICLGCLAVKLVCMPTVFLLAFMSLPESASVMQHDWYVLNMRFCL